MLNNGSVNVIRRTYCDMKVVGFLKIIFVNGVYAGIGGLVQKFSIIIVNKKSH